jgi:hypothetical protein
MQNTSLIQGIIPTCRVRRPLVAVALAEAQALCEGGLNNGNVMILSL